ncbi:ATP-dependent Clp protease proteolytic subunit [Candidatus Vidania fulgoroideorum]
MKYLNRLLYSGRNEYYNINNTLLKERIILLIGEIDDYLANSIICQMLYLEKMDKNLDINIYINSPGGSVYSGLAIYDVMNLIKNDVKTVCYGIAASMGAFILSSGKYGKRYSLPNSRIMIHQPIGGFNGQATDMKIHTREILYLKKKINKILSFNTKKKESIIKKDCERDKFMSPSEALNYGLIDNILKK